MTKRTSSCQCGLVKFESIAHPILAGVCYCDDCQAGNKMLEALSDAPPVLDEDGGSNYLTYREDHYQCVAGENLLKAHKLRDTSKTKRYIASCCNSAMYIKFGPGHWVSTFRNRYDGETPPVEMRTQIQFRETKLPFPDNAPTHKKFPISLFAKLIKARVAMIFGR